ncbi:MAG TPA: hypothetical protein VGP93_06280 [Polyangiaceae bacterium]|jgi:hypothetical protein|nr:hypothetical protein [Polyangiaceae bacterium]
MSIKRITISVPVKVASRIKKAAGETPVSAWVTEVIEQRLNDSELDRLWQKFYKEVSPATKEIRRAEAMLKRLTKRRGRRGAA